MKRLLYITMLVLAGCASTDTPLVDVYDRDASLLQWHIDNPRRPGIYTPAVKATAPMPMQARYYALPPVEQSDNDTELKLKGYTVYSSPQGVVYAYDKTVNAYMVLWWSLLQPSTVAVECRDNDHVRIIPATGGYVIDYDLEGRTVSVMRP